MGRPKRAADGGLVYHVLNRANPRMTIFADEADYAAFEEVLEEAVERTPLRLLAYCAMPTRIGIWSCGRVQTESCPGSRTG
jgi:putative transposase